MPRKTPLDWSNTPEHLRHRKHVHLTLPDDALALLATLAAKCGCSRSELVEAWTRETAAGPLTQKRIAELLSVIGKTPA